MTIDELVELNDTFEVLDDNTGEVLLTDAEWQEFDNCIRFESVSTGKWLAVVGRDDVRFRRPDSVALSNIADAWMTD